MDVVLGKNRESHATVAMDAQARFQGTYVIGANGTGKTTVLLNMIIQDIAAGAGVCVIDPHGDLTDDILTRISPARAQDVLLLDPLAVKTPFPLNIFACDNPDDPILVQGVVEQVIHIFQKIWESSWGPQLEDLLRSCAYTLIDAQLTMLEIPQLLEDTRYRAGMVQRLTNPEVKRFWEREYNRWEERDQQTRRASTLNKVREFVLNPILRPIIGQNSTIDFRRVMDEGKILLVKLSLSRLKEGPTALLGGVIVAQLLNAALSRQDLPPSKRTPFFLYADEYHRFAIPDFATLLAEARKYGVSTTVAHQFRDQLDFPNKGATFNA